MKLKRVRLISRIVAGVGCAVLLAPRLALPMADWAVRAAGVLTLLALFVQGFASARLGRRQKGETPRRDEPQKQ